MTNTYVDGKVDGQIPCHSHIHQGSPIEPVCRGYFDRRSSSLLVLAEQVDRIKFINPTTEKSK